MRLDPQPNVQEWNRFVSLHPDGHILQTSGWGELKSRFGWYHQCIAIREGESIIAGAQVLFRRFPLGRTLAYAPKGPLTDLNRDDACKRLFDALHQTCRSQRAFALKIEPDTLESADLSTQLVNYAFYPSEQTVQPRRTILVDIRGSEDEILKRMKSKTRYNIRLSGRKGVRVHEGTHRDMDAFHRLMAETGQRDGFGVHSPTYYEQAYHILTRADMARLFVATYEEQPLASILACACGQKAWYMYGASGNEHRERMPTYALQWAAIRWARSRGCTTYDLWGVPDEDKGTLEAQFAERGDGLWGVYRNKRGFGGQLVRYAGAFDHVYNRPLYRLYRFALKLRER